MSERWVEVSHEALIRGWPLLKNWIEEDRDRLRMHRRLTEAALEWNKMNRDQGALYRGTRLTQATEWRQANEASLNDLERAFLDAGAALERQEANARKRRRLRVIGGIAIAIALMTLTFQQWRHAGRRGQIALARQLAGQVDLLSSEQEMLPRRLALAAEAMRLLREVKSSSLEVDATLRRELAFLPRHVARFPVIVKGTVDDIHLSPDGRFVIGGNYSEGVASVWEITTGKELVHIETNVREVIVTRHGQEPVRLQIKGMGGSSQIKDLSSDGKALVTVSGDGNVDVVQVWETNGRELLHVDLSGNNHYALSNDGKYLAVSTSIYDNATNKWSESITHVWDVQARRKVSGSAPGDINGFSQDATLVSTSQGLWETAGGLKERLVWGMKGATTTIDTEGGYVAVNNEDNGVDVWSTATRQKVVSIPMAAHPLALTPDGKLVITHFMDEDGADEVQVHDVSLGAIVSRTRLFGDTTVVTPSGQMLIANATGKAMDVWELRPEGGAVIAVDHESKVVAVGLTPFGRLTTITRNGEKLITQTWDLDASQEIQNLALELSGTGATFGPDGLSFAVMSESGLEVRRVGDPQPVVRLAYTGLREVVWSPDGRYLAASTERDARVWDLNSRQSVGQLAMPGRPAVLALAEGGGSLAAIVASGEKKRAGELHWAKLWNVASGEELKSFEPDEGQSIRGDIHCALDARYLVAQSLAVLEMKSGALHVQLGQAEEVDHCTISSDGRYLATSSSQGGMVRLWDLENGRETFRLPTNDPPVAFDQESRYLATISEENTVRVWSLRQDDLIAEACRRLPRNLSEPEWREYVGDEPYRKTCPELP